MSYLLAGVLLMMAVTILLRLAPFVVLARIADTPLAHFLRVMMPAGVMVILSATALVALTSRVRHTAFPASPRSSSR